MKDKRRKITRKERPDQRDPVAARSPTASGFFDIRPANAISRCAL
jgi:hypothetical protein